MTSYTIPSEAGLDAKLLLKAPLASPAFTGTPTIGGTAVAKTTDITAAITNLVNGASTALDTLSEIDAQMAADEGSAAALSILVASKAAALTAQSVSTATTGTLTVDTVNPVDATSAVATRTLPAPTKVGQVIEVEKTDASSNAVNVAGTIRGVSSSIALVWQYETVGLVAESLTSWRPVYSHKTKAALDRAYVAPLGKTSSGAAAPLSRVNIIDQGAVADARTVIDAAIPVGTPTLTSATAAFTSTDIGKTVVLGFAGTPGPATTTTSALSTGAAITAIPVAALPSTLAAGTVVVTSGSNVQAFQTTGAASGATSIPVTSFTPYFAFPSGSTVTTPVLPLKSTITAVNSGTSVTLAGNAGATVTAGEAVIGTNNYTAIQAAITAAITFRVPLYIPAAPQGAEGFLYDGALTVNGNLAIDGDGAFEQHTVGGGGGLLADNGPSQAPWLTGSVLIQAAANTDGLSFTQGMSVNPMRNFGIRFAGKLINTGHGFHWTPPITSSTFQDNGLMDSVLEGLKVFGHDGHHYGFDIMNSLYCTFINLHSFGGGGILMEQNSNICDCGNAVFIHPVSMVFAGGVAAGLTLANQALSGYLNYITLLRPQAITFFATTLQAAGYPAPVSTQQIWKIVTQGASTNPLAAGQVSNITWISPDGETTVGSSGSLVNPSGTGSIIHGGVGQNWATNADPTTAVQNLSGTMVLWQAVYDFVPTPLGNAELILQTGGTSNPTSTLVHETVPAGAAAVGGTLSSALTTGAAITSIPVNALTGGIPIRGWFTLVSGTNQQSFQVSSVVSAGATSIPVFSQTPNFAYPSGSTFYFAHRKTVQCMVLPNQWLRSVPTNAKWPLIANTLGVVSAV